MAYAVQATTHYQTCPERPPGAVLPPKKVCNLDPMASLVALVAATSGRALGREPADHLHRRRRLNEDEDDDRRHSREAHLLAIVLGVLFFATIMCVVACLVHCTISLMPNGQLARASREMSLSKVHPRAPDEDLHVKAT